MIRTGNHHLERAPSRNGSGLFRVLRLGPGQVQSESRTTVNGMDLADVTAAAERIAPWAIRTPVITSAAIDNAVGAQVFLKAECLQRTGAFKFRGAMNSLQSLTTEQRNAGVVAFSSGNHAQAVAASASLVGSSSVIVMPHDAPSGKVQSTLDHGARVVRYDRYTEDRAAIAREIAEAEGRTLIPPYDHAPVVAGQGTVGLELFEQVSDLDAVVVCLGGGGLLAGCSTVADSVSPNTAMYGVEPAEGDDHRRSRAAGERVTIEVPRTIADGQQTTAPGQLTWPITNAIAADFLAVTDDQIIAAMRLLFSEAKLVVEPSGASAFAAVMHRRTVAGASSPLAAATRIGVTLSGGNVDLDRFVELTTRKVEVAS